MKTIKRAIGSKSAFLGKLALPFLLLIAVVGIEIGGGQTPPRDPRPSNGPDIGGQSAPRHYATTSTEIGGSQTAPSHVNPLGLPIGGNSAPRGYAVSEPSGQQDAKPGNGEPISFPNIGGNSCPRCGMSGVAIEIPPIGGTQSPPRPIDIGGGQLPPKSPLYLSSFLTDCTVDIGGNQGVPQLPLPIGGNGGGSTAPRAVFPIIIGS